MSIIPDKHQGSASVAGRATVVDRRLLEILVCPLTKTTLVYDAERQELVSHAARLAYPIRDGIPIMLPEEARSLDDTSRVAQSPSPGLGEK